MTPDLFRHLVAQASLAPSVHNVQPARWRLVGDTVFLLEDKTVRLPAADPTGHDASMSLGAAFEGMVMAAAQEGLRITHQPVDEEDNGDLRSILRLKFAPGAAKDPLMQYVDKRQSWRGKFGTATDDDKKTAEALRDDDCLVVTGPNTIRVIAKLLDMASFLFVVRDDFRAELLSWMRLGRRHPDWARDGLNADAMRLGFFEKIGAGIVMGRGFRPLLLYGIAEKLLSEEEKTAGATAIMVFHRPEGEDPFESGRAFYRAWLRIDAAGFGAAVLAALADDLSSAETLAAMVELPKGRRIVSAFRIGRRPPHKPFPAARRPLDELIV
ncbi:hypothetical protein [Cognatiyoonia sp. IB215182]|uniref:hypothetical protein n=1 Tax=Cognatiyoonia sp. IB215182 TaxID=3097353 RepID=UPI002A132C3D|nr:hypothetical protein [Cognatiyoonia sp. IB215182]MDX8352993.1 hypothetical protein [Cognatiyoonia sp. IB215182]